MICLFKQSFLIVLPHISHWHGVFFFLEFLLYSFGNLLSPLLWYSPYFFHNLSFCIVLRFQGFYISIVFGFHFYLSPLQIGWLRGILNHFEPRLFPYSCPDCSPTVALTVPLQGAIWLDIPIMILTKTSPLGWFLSKSGLVFVKTWAGFCQNLGWFLSKSGSFRSWRSHRCYQIGPLGFKCFVKDHEL